MYFTLTKHTNLCQTTKICPSPCTAFSSLCTARSSCKLLSLSLSLKDEGRWKMICSFNKSLGLPGFSCCRDDRQESGGLWLAGTHTYRWMDRWKKNMHLWYETPWACVAVECVFSVRMRGVTAVSQGTEPPRGPVTYPPLHSDCLPGTQLPTQPPACRGEGTQLCVCQ